MDLDVISKTTVALALLILLSVTSVTYAEIGVKDNSYWIGAGPAISDASDNGLVASVSHQRGNMVFSARGSAFFNDFPDDIHNWDAAVLIGTGSRSGNGFIWAGTGLAIGEVTARTFRDRGWGLITEYEKKAVVGLPLALEVSFGRSPVGLSVYALGNLNLEKSFFGGGLCLQFTDF